MPFNRTCRQCGRDYSSPGRTIRIYFCSAACWKASTKRQYLIDSVKAHGDSDECLLWPFSKTKEGYGKVGVGSDVLLVTRFAYETFVGPVGDKWVLHRCDNPACYSPRHMFLGTHEDNMADMTKKGRQAKTGKAHGETHPWSKLTQEQVDEIRRVYDRTKYHTGATDLARRFGVHPSTIRSIAAGRTWKEITDRACVRVQL